MIPTATANEHSFCYHHECDDDYCNTDVSFFAQCLLHCGSCCRICYASGRRQPQRRGRVYRHGLCNHMYVCWSSVNTKHVFISHTKRCPVPAAAPRSICRRQKRMRRYGARRWIWEICTFLKSSRRQCRECASQRHRRDNNNDGTCEPEPQRATLLLSRRLVGVAQERRARWYCCGVTV